MRVKIAFLALACLACFVPPSTGYSIRIPEANPCGSTTTEASTGCGEGISTLKKDVITKVLSLGKSIVSGAVNIGASIVAKKLAILSAPDCPKPCPTTPEPTTTTTTTPKPTTTTEKPCHHEHVVIHKPEIHKPDIHLPEIHKPEIHKPEIHKPEIHLPVIHRSEIHKPDPCEHAHEVTYEYIIYANDDPSRFVQHAPHHPDVICDEQEHDVVAYFK